MPIIVTAQDKGYGLSAHRLELFTCSFHCSGDAKSEAGPLNPVKAGRELRPWDTVRAVGLKGVSNP